MIIIHVEKCTTFGVKSFSISSLGFQPKLLINSELIPPVKQGESFKYLGRYFNFDMDNKDNKAVVRNRLLLYDRYVLSEFSWHLTVTDLGKNGFVKTWITL